MRIKYLAILAFFLPVAALAAYVVPQGGTGQSTLPASQLLTGNGTSAIYGTATTTASCSGATSCNPFTIIGASPVTISSTNSGGTVTQINTTWPILGGPITTTGTLTFGGLSTSTAAVVGNIPYFSGVNTFANVATSTLTATSPLTGSFTHVGSSGSLGCQTASGSQAGCLSSTDWTTFNNKGSGTLTAVTGTWPIISSGGTTPNIMWGGLATSTNLVAGHVVYSSGIGSVTDIATSSVSAGTGVTFTGTAGALVGGTSLTINTPWTISGSNIHNNNAANIGIGTTTPGSLLSIGNSGWNFYNNATTTKNGVGGINISGGCYAIGGTCLATGGSGTVTSVGLSDSNSTLTIGSTPVTTSGTITATLNLAHSNTWSVKQTFSAASTTALTAASEFNAPHSGTVPTLYGGDFYINTNSTASSSLAFSDGTNTRNLFSTHSFSMVLASSTLAYIGAYGASGTTTINIANPQHYSTLHSYYCKTDIGTAYVGFGNGTATTTETQCTSSGTQVTVSTNNTWPGRGSVLLEVGREASTPNLITVTADVEDSN